MNTESTILDLNHQYLDAMKRGDAGWFERYLAEDFACIESDGTLRDKTGFVRKISAGPAFASYDLTEKGVRTYGPIAMVQARGDFARPDGSRGTSRYIDVYRLANGAWTVISAQVTRVPIENGGVA